MTACTTVPSNPTPSAALILPDVKAYSPEEQKAVADELKACGQACKYTRQMMKDFKTTRDEIRVALRKLTKGK